jgi:L-asparagine oxygenase
MMTLVDANLLMRQLVTFEGWCIIPPELAIRPVPDILAVLGPLLPADQTQTCCRELVPYDRKWAPPGSMSAMTGTAAQPMHTDGAYFHLPPRYIALECVDPGEAYCPTHVQVPDLARLRGTGLPGLTKALWVSRGGGRAPFYCSVLETQSGITRLRFDPLCMRLAHAGTEAANEVRAAIESCSMQVEIQWRSGSLLIVDNWRCLHARGEGASQAPSRRLRRWMIGAN